MIDTVVNILDDGSVLIASSYDGVMFFTRLYKDGVIEKDYIAPSYRQEMTPARLLQQQLHNIIHDEIVMSHLK
ncbi:hypothetical protein OGV37_00230 [Citrobacter sp. Cb010]|jgi:hypothetical protein|uniref:hypothetical protein n=1 Tax=Citrobacter TaxID=544 RepID=UPI00190122B4|nr:MULTISPECIES: hypothetical protein [unclassified Citrobacter]MBJ9270088.1 hypothetical protein [Citrobacter freundii]MDM3373323.1 hypothetical protein [Citrobacter sp. Cb010]MDM3460494.1 hypothetical protein [Citrobacter sp. Cb036]